MRTLALVALTLAGLFTIFAIVWVVAGPPSPGMPMATPPTQIPGGMTRDPTPPVKGFYKGQQILFIHTEASDQKVAEMLTRMMGPKVLVVPSLKEIPGRLLADVYVFTNGVKGEGPFGFQPDVFDTAPGDPRYTPLRRVKLVTWKDSAQPRVLRSLVEVQNARSKGEITVTQPGVVVNMPFLRWPGGQR